MASSVFAISYRRRILALRRQVFSDAAQRKRRRASDEPTTHGDTFPEQACSKHQRTGRSKGSEERDQGSLAYANAALGQRKERRQLG